MAITYTPGLHKKVCVTGANGFIGRQLINELLKLGYDVKVLTRSSTSVFPKSIEIIIGDLTKNNCPLDRFLADADLIINCAGEINEDRQMKPLHVDGTKLLINAADEESRKTGKKIHWVQLSSCGLMVLQEKLI